MVQWSSTLPCGRTNQTGCPQMLKGYNTYLLTPWCRVLLEELTGVQLVRKFPAFYGTRRFITALTSVRHLSLSWASPIQSTSHLPEIHPNIIHPSTPRSPQWSLSKGYNKKTYMYGTVSGPVAIPKSGNLYCTQFYVLWKLQHKCNYRLLLAAEHPLIGFVWAEMASDSHDEQQVTFDLTDGSLPLRQISQCSIVHGKTHNSKEQESF